MPTNKDLLNEILVQNKDLARKQLDLAAQFSIYQNEQELRFYKIESYLKSDPDTNTEGAIEKLSRIDKKLTALEKDIIKKSTTFAVGASALIISIKWIFSKLL